MDPPYARRIGVNIDELLVSQPDTGEQALEICELLIRSGALDVVAIDSVAALTPKAEIEGEMGDSHVGLQARLMSQALRKLAGTLNRTDTICLFTNQLREKIGVMFGSPETTPGGRALKFYSSVRLDIRRIETLKDGAEAFGNRVRVKVVKNKVAPPFKQAEFDIIYGSGISWEGTVLDVGLERKIVKKSGSYFSFGDERLGQGRQNATAFLAENPDLVQPILGRIQAEAPAEQVVSARLLPTAARPTRPVEAPRSRSPSRPSGRSTELRVEDGRSQSARRLAVAHAPPTTRRAAPARGPRSTARVPARRRDAVEASRARARSAAVTSSAASSRHDSERAARRCRARRRRETLDAYGARRRCALRSSGARSRSPSAAQATCIAHDLERPGSRPSCVGRRAGGTRAGAGARPRASSRGAERARRRPACLSGTGLRARDRGGGSLQAVATRELG